MSTLSSSSLGIAAVVLTFIPLAGQSLDGMPAFEKLISLDLVNQVAVAPDGRSVAYTVRRTDWEENEYDVEIWLAPEQGKPYQLTRTSGSSSTLPEWSPDGRWLAFLADRGEKSQVFLIAPNGGEAHAVTHVEEGVSAFHWAPSGERLALLVAEPAGDDVEARSRRYGAFGFDDETGPDSHIWILSIGEDGTGDDPERLTEGDFHVADFEWSPDGSRVAYVRQPSAALLSSVESDIYVIEVESGNTHGLVTGPGPDDAPVWSPDGQWILFSEFDRDLGSLYYLNGELARIPADGGPIEVLTREFDEQPLDASWTESGIRFRASYRVDVRLYALDAATQVVRELTQPTPIVSAVSFTPDGRTMAVAAQSAISLAEVYRGPVEAAAGGTSPVDVRRFEKMTEVTAQADGWDVGTREVVRWISEDGTEIEGVVSKPSSFDPSRRYPLLVIIHGGPTGTSRPTMVSSYVYPIVHWLAKGAVVLEPNYRGSAGYGELFRSLNVRNLGVGDMWDVMSGVEHLVDAGVADPARMGAMGWSQGGYISAFLTTNTDVFQAISVGAGISNWMTYYVNTDIHPFTRQYLKATPWSDPDIYARTSPMTSINRASTPTLIQHGDLDPRVPIPNAYELLQGLQDVGVEARLAVYRGFGHTINKPKELLAAQWHNWIWFGKHIWGESIELPLDSPDDEAGDTAPKE